MNRYCDNNDDEAPVLKTEVSTRELSRLVTLYSKRVAPQSTQDRVGVIRQIQRLLNKGLSLHELQTAIEHYAAHVKDSDKDNRYVKKIRSFMTEQTIRDWQKPLPQSRKQQAKQRDPALDILDRLDSLYVNS